MLNQVVLVGRIVEKTERENENIIKIATQRAYKNEKGQYDTDIFECEIFGNVAGKVTEWCETGDLIGIKGRLETKEDKLKIIGERVTLLTNKKGDHNE